MSALGKWHMEIQVYRRPNLPAFSPLTLQDEIRRRWAEAGRPDDETALRGVILAAVDSMAGWFDPARLHEMKASVRVWKEETLTPSAIMGSLRLPDDDEVDA